MIEETKISASAKETEHIGELIGSALRGGEVIELISDLGGGKTTLTRGIVKGAGSHDQVSSPTFTVSRLYETLELTIHHFDFYRLQEPGLIIHELHEAQQDPNAVIIIEWGEVVAENLSNPRLKIEIISTGNDTRELKLTIPDEYKHLHEAIKSI